MSTHLSTGFSRAELFKKGATGGTALLAAGSAFAVLAPAAAADPLSDNDLALARILVATELLGIDFYTQATAAKKLDKRAQRRFGQALENEQEHYQSVAQILSGAGQVPATPDDIDMSYPRGTFDSSGAILKQGRQVENIMLGCYLGAIGAFLAPSLVPGLATIAASEAQHVSYFQAAFTGKPFALAFPGPPLNFDQATTALDKYQS